MKKKQIVQNLIDKNDEDDVDIDMVVLASQVDKYGYERDISMMHMLSNRSSSLKRDN